MRAQQCSDDSALYAPRACAFRSSRANFLPPLSLSIAHPPPLPLSPRVLSPSLLFRTSRTACLRTGISRYYTACVYVISLTLSGARRERERERLLGFMCRGGPRSGISLL